LTGGAARSHDPRVSATWTCPACGRKVPARVPECYCGARRDQVLAATGAEQARTRQDRRDTLVAVSGVIAAVAIGFALLGRGPAEPPPAADPSPAVTTTPVPATRPPVADVAPTPTPTLFPAAARPAPAEPLPTESPSTPPTPTAVDAEREQGAQEYRQQMTALAQRATSLREEAENYASQCRTSQAQVVRVLGCEENRVAILNRVESAAREVEAADDAARRAWMQPGARRQARQSIDDTLAECRRVLGGS
jgi:hypothetical protein